MTVSSPGVYYTHQLCHYRTDSDSSRWVKLSRKNLEKCLRASDPFGYEFLQDGQRYSPIQCAMILNDLESLQCLLQHPSAQQEWCELAVFFYINRLTEYEKPNLEILKCLLAQLLTHLRRMQ